MKINRRNSNLKRRRKIGFLSRSRTRGGRAILRRRRRIGRRLTPKM